MACFNWFLRNSDCKLLPEHCTLIESRDLFVAGQLRFRFVELSVSGAPNRVTSWREASMRRLLLLALVFGWAVCAYAGPVEFKFIGFKDGQWQNGYPYAIQPLGGSSTSILFVMCDDYFHGGTVGDTWEANITQLGSDN